MTPLLSPLCTRSDSDTSASSSLVHNETELVPSSVVSSCSKNSGKVEVKSGFLDSEKEDVETAEYFSDSIKSGCQTKVTCRPVHEEERERLEDTKEAGGEDGRTDEDLEESSSGSLLMVSPFNSPTVSLSPDMFSQDQIADLFSDQGEEVQDDWLAIISRSPALERQMSVCLSAVPKTADIMTQCFI